MIYRLEKIYWDLMLGFWRMRSSFEQWAFMFEVPAEKSSYIRSYFWKTLGQDKANR